MALPVIFVVDDEAVIAQTLAVILLQNGYSAVSFTHPSEALRKAQTSSPDLLLTDVVMPEFSGIELAVKVRAMYPRCPILLFSGQAGTSELLHDKRIAEQSFHVLAKPVHPGELLQEIKNLLKLKR